MTDYTYRVASEILSVGVTLPASIFGTPTPRNPYADLAREMALVTTPYHPCTDLNWSEHD